MIAALSGVVVVVGVVSFVAGFSGLVFVGVFGASLSLSLSLSRLRGGAVPVA